MTRILASLTLLFAAIATGITQDDGKDKIEIKYLLINDKQEVIDQFEKKQNVSALPSETMAIYFFDTSNRDLLGEGLILRLRHKDGKWIFTAKLRPAPAQIPADASGGELVWEETIGAEKPMQSYSVNSELSDPQAQQAIASNGLAGLLSSGHGIPSSFSVPWDKVHATPEITATRWKLPALKKLDAEEWRFKGQRILELSLSGKAEKRADHENDLKKFLDDSGLKDPSGGMKTETVLRALLP